MIKKKQVAVPSLTSSSKSCINKTRIISTDPEMAEIQRVKQELIRHDKK